MLASISIVALSSLPLYWRAVLAALQRQPVSDRVWLLPSREWAP